MQIRRGAPVYALLLIASLLLLGIGAAVALPAASKSDRTLADWWAAVLGVLMVVSGTVGVLIAIIRLLE